MVRTTALGTECRGCRAREFSPPTAAASCCPIAGPLLDQHCPDAIRPLRGSLRIHCGRLELLAVVIDGRDDNLLLGNGQVVEPVLALPVPILRVVGVGRGLAEPS